MSDYLYLLENHLSEPQNRIASALLEAASAAGLTLHLTGGAMRDLLGGVPTRHLDFTLSGNPVKLAALALAPLGAVAVRKDDLRKQYGYRFPNGLTAEIGMSRTEHYAKPGAKPHVTPSDIREDLLRRDFTVNAIALGLNRSAKGLLADPTNGLADLGSRELRTTNGGAFADRPIRMARLVRFKHRLQFAVAERTERQLDNAREAKLARFILPADWFEELFACGNETAQAAILREWEALGILEPLGWNTAAVQRLEKLRASVSFPGQGWRDGWGPLYLAMTEGASGRDKSAMAVAWGVTEEATASLKRLQAQARKLEAAIIAPSLKRPSDLYRSLRTFAPDEILYALNCSTKRLVQDRIRTTLQKHLPLALEMRGATEAEIVAALNAKPKKPEVELVSAD